MTSELLSNLRALVALLLLGLSLPCLAMAYRRALAVWRDEADPASRRLALGATAVAAFVRWVVAPKQIVTMYIGYLLTEQAIELSAASHYGMGSLALYHALFALFPRDHRTLLWTNAVVGVLTLPLAATFGARYLRSPRAGAIFAALVALAPLFIKNDASDANQVPCLWWTFGGLVLLERYLDAGERSALAGAVPLFALAANARPEMPVLLPVLVGLLVFGLGPSRARLRDPALAVALVVAALLVAPQALHVFGSVEALEDRDSLPGASVRGLSHLLSTTLTEDTVLTPSLYPVALVPLALVGLAEPLLDRSRREALRARVALLSAAVVTLAIYGLDLCRANMARVHVPGALLVTLLAAAGLAYTWERLRPVARGAVALAVALTAVPTASKLWAPTNEQAEEDFLRRALAELPSGGLYTLVRMDRVDRERDAPGSAFTHRHFPDYLVRPPVGTGRLSSIRDFLDQPDLTHPAFFYWGMRCYAEFRPAGTPPPHGDALQPACARLRDRFELEPVLEQTVPNRGDVWLDYYGDAKELRLGLYRVIRPR